MLPRRGNATRTKILLALIVSTIIIFTAIMITAKNHGVGRTAAETINVSNTATTTHSAQIIAQTSKECSLSKARIAVYNGPGVWNSGLEAIKLYLSSRRIDFALVNASTIKEQGLRNYNVLIIPGGWSYDYYKELGPTGEAAIKRFVQRGGGYLGVCAGAYLAAKAIVWEANIYHYSLGIADVLAIGPKPNYPWPTQAYIAINMTSIGIENGLNATYRALYYGGPEFKPLDNNTVTVVAVYGDSGNPAIILTRYGEGRVALTGVHLEVSENTWPVLDFLIKYLLGCIEPTK